MLNVKQSYIIAKNLSPNLYLISILNFGEDFGFLFSKKKNESMIGSSYILINPPQNSFLVTSIKEQIVESTWYIELYHKENTTVREGGSTDGE